DGILQRAVQICEQCASEMGEEKPLVIEITEREFLQDTREAHRILQPFLDYGFRIAVDDFGSGFSSFRYLADLPVSVLKIEGDLVRRATGEPRVQAILRGIRDIAGELGLTTIAEMVEDEETADFLREIGIDLAQGFHFAYPALVSEPWKA
ncbi:MAG: EAL domain-containing protein, partial [Thiohalorhabdaceae bacterium]